MKNIIIIGAGDQVSNLAHLIAKQGFNVIVTEVPNREHTYKFENKKIPELDFTRLISNEDFSEYKDGRTFRRENRKKNRKKK